MLKFEVEPLCFIAEIDSAYFEQLKRNTVKLLSLNEFSYSNVKQVFDFIDTYDDELFDFQQFSREEVFAIYEQAKQFVIRAYTELSPVCFRRLEQGSRAAATAANVCRELDSLTPALFIRKRSCFSDDSAANALKAMDELLFS